MAVVIVGLAGLLFGSFASVLAGRWYVDARPWWTGRSHCPHCDQQIAWYDNIPVVSWLWLRARCRSCGTRISAVYPALELLMAAGWAAVAALFDDPFVVIGLLGVWFFSVVLTHIDVRHHRLPTPLVYALSLWWVAAVLIRAAVGQEWTVLAGAGVGLGAMGGFYGLMWFIKPSAIGFGDVRLGAALGMVLGSLGWQQLAVGAIAGPLLGGLLALVAIARARKARGVMVPYGPALLAGAWLGIAAAHVIGPWYLSLYTT